MFCTSIGMNNAFLKRKEKEEVPVYRLKEMFTYYTLIN